VKRPHQGTNQDRDTDAKNNDDDSNQDDEGSQEDNENDADNNLGPWPEVEDHAISKGKMKGPVRGEGGNQGQRNKGKGKKFVIISILH